MRPARNLLFAIILASLATAPAYSARALAATPGQLLKLSCSLQKRVVTLHEPVFVQLRAVNQADRPARLDLGFDRKGNLRFLVSAPGKKETIVVPRPHGGLARQGLVTVAPHGSFTQEILLSALYRFSSEGHYLIRVELSSGGRAGHKGQSLPYESQKMVLHVLPRNPSKLRRVCANLVEAIMSGDAESAMESAVALSHVNDPVAIPYLERTARNSPFSAVIRPIAINGLARLSLVWGKTKVFSLLPQKDPQIEEEISAAMKTVRKHGGALSH